MKRVAASLETPEVEDWKADGNRVVGYFCSTVPEELFTAAGMMAFRMRGTGSTSTEYADANFTPINCSFPRHCFNEALEGNFEFLDALIVINSCDHIRRIYDNWLKELDEPDFVHIMAPAPKDGAATGRVVPRRHHPVEGPLRGALRHRDQRRRRP
ncbi:MAG: 2-hydroxyacyl-CoA dehydratase family protein [Microthrixaceae bacterium]|nr:2-hydroxyacyl-CoA dehydratase family protein [Microthrixaceae bacterium]